LGKSGENACIGVMGKLKITKGPEINVGRKRDVDRICLCRIFERRV